MKGVNFGLCPKTSMEMRGEGRVMHVCLDIRFDCTCKSTRPRQHQLCSFGHCPKGRTNKCNCRHLHHVSLVSLFILLLFVLPFFVCSFPVTIHGPNYVSFFHYKFSVKSFARSMLKLVPFHQPLCPPCPFRLASIKIHSIIPITRRADGRVPSETRSGRRAGHRRWLACPGRAARRLPRLERQEKDER